MRALNIKGMTTTEKVETQEIAEAILKAKNITFDRINDQTGLYYVFCRQELVVAMWDKRAKTLDIFDPPREAYSRRYK